MVLETPTTPTNEPRKVLRWTKPQRIQARNEEDRAMLSKKRQHEDMILAEQSRIEKIRKNRALPIPKPSENRKVSEGIINKASIVKEKSQTKNDLDVLPGANACDEKASTRQSIDELPDSKRSPHLRTKKHNKQAEETNGDDNFSDDDEDSSQNILKYLRDSGWVYKWQSSIASSYVWFHKKAKDSDFDPEDFRSKTFSSTADIIKAFKQYKYGNRARYIHGNASIFSQKNPSGCCNHQGAVASQNLHSSLSKTTQLIEAGWLRNADKDGNDSYLSPIVTRDIEASSAENHEIDFVSTFPETEASLEFLLKKQNDTDAKAIHLAGGSDSKNDFEGDREEALYIAHDCMPFRNVATTLAGITKLSDLDREEFLQYMEDDIVEKASLRWVGREEEVAELVSALSSRCSLSRSIFVHGDTGTGKSTIVRDVLNNLACDFCWINCDVCFTPAKFFELILLSVQASDDREESLSEAQNSLDSLEPHTQSVVDGVDCEDVITGNESAELNTALERRPQYRKDFGMQGFALRFLAELHRKSKSSEWTSMGLPYCFTIVFDNANTLVTSFPGLLQYFLNFNTQSRFCIRVVLIGNPVGSHGLRFLHTSNIQWLCFKPYTQKQCDLIVYRALAIRLLPKISDGNRDWDGCWRCFCKKLAQYVCKVCYTEIRNVNELVNITVDSFWYLLQKIPLSRNMTSFADSNFQNMVDGRIKHAIARLFKHDWQHDIEGFDHSSESTASIALVDAAEIPYDTKMLLIAAYIASYNKPKYDKELAPYSGPKSKREKIIAGQKIGGGTRATKKAQVIPQRLRGPAPFPLDRLLWIYMQLLRRQCGNKAATESFNRGTTNHLQRLTSMGMIKCVSKTNVLSKLAYICCASREYITTIGRTIHDFDPDHFLYE